MPMDRIKLLKSIGFDFDGGKTRPGKATGKAYARSLSESSESSDDSSDSDSSSDSTEYENASNTGESSSRIPVELAKVEGKITISLHTSVPLRSPGTQQHCCPCVCWRMQTWKTIWIRWKSKSGKRKKN